MNDEEKSITTGVKSWYLLLEIRKLVKIKKTHHLLSICLYADRFAQDFQISEAKFFNTTVEPLYLDSPCQKKLKLLYTFLYNSQWVQMERFYSTYVLHHCKNIRYLQTTRLYF